MTLQKDMMIMLLSMLEGNVVNGPIGKQMVDTLVESSANFELILKFFDIFLKMKGFTTSEAFMEFDVNRDGVISPKEFRLAMIQQKVYTDEEIDYIMLCVDANQDGKVDFHEFTDRFHGPAKDIGFNVAVLLRNLSEHIPFDPRLQRFVEKASSVLDYFEPYLGRIEIMGSAGRIERVYFEIKQSHVDQWEKPQIKESKRAFLHNLCQEEGSKGKFESFTNFCEDAIFEMQHATSISAEEQQLKMAHYSSSKSQSDSDGGGFLDLLRMGGRAMKSGIKLILSMLAPSNISKKYNQVRCMSVRELFTGFFRLNLRLVITLLTFLFMVVWTFFKFIYVMMRGEQYAPPRQALPTEKSKVKLKISAAQQKATIASMLPDDSLLQNAPVDAFGFGLSVKGPDVKDEPVSSPAVYPDTGSKAVQNGKLTGAEKQDDRTATMQTLESVPGGMETTELMNGAARTANTERLKKKSSANNLMTVASKTTDPVTDEYSMPPLEEQLDTTHTVDEMNVLERGTARVPESEQVGARSEGMNFWMFISSMFARNFYTFKLIALALAFCINFLLLFFKVTKASAELGDDDDDDAVADLLNATLGLDSGGDDDDEDGGFLEYVYMEDKVYYLSPVLRLLALLHTFTAFAMIIGYYCLKVPLVVFKREKEVARSLEFDGMWIIDQPSDDDIKGHWDKLVISTRSFPDKYWDKFVKKKVRNKYSEQYEHEMISNLLGMEDAAFATKANKDMASILPSFLTEIDWRYDVWKWGIIFTDNAFLYIAFYFVFSMLGNFNYFFFAAHLMDVAVCIKTLGTILQSVTHNGKQLVLTVMLLSIIVYLYTVIAFNFFRKFYVQEEEGEEADYKCHDMLSCYVFHLYVGVRAGGGIGDEINPPDGDPYEVYRILFDITFFFFVIVILLAIIQGLIIDAFGELRDQLEQVKEDLESSCFICGIGKDYFDKIPHGFENHVSKEHNFANYMFFLMHLINKPDTEYTGQESYVWGLYQQRRWDFFPVGECFRKQYEEELTPR